MPLTNEVLGELTYLRAEENLSGDKGYMDSPDKEVLNLQRISADTGKINDVCAYVCPLFYLGFLSSQFCPNFSRELRKLGNGSRVTRRGSLCWSAREARGHLVGPGCHCTSCRLGAQGRAGSLSGAE